MSGRENTMMSKAMIATRVLKRKNWLGSASVLAAATALMAVASADTAQAQSGISGQRSLSPTSEVMAPREVSRRQVAAPRRIPSVPRPNQPNNRVILPNGSVNAVAPTSQTQVTVAPVPSAPSSPSVSVASPPPIVIISQSTGPVFAPDSVNGIAVQATAEFDNTQIDFRPGVAGDVVEVLGTSAIIDWRTFTSGAANTDVTFLGAGDNLDFTSNQADYTVLNRIFTPNFDSAVRIDGNVTSTVSGGNAIGGNVWFYSPGGLIIGANAAFNVGSLLLSTSTIDPADVSAGALDVDFTGVTDTDSFIRIEDTASITANNNNSYVAMIAPRIEQGGSVRTKGSTAYVAAEEATMTIQNGLFDISVDTPVQPAGPVRPASLMSKRFTLSQCPKTPQSTCWWAARLVMIRPLPPRWIMVRSSSPRAIGWSGLIQASTFSMHWVTEPPCRYRAIMSSHRLTAAARAASRSKTSLSPASLTCLQRTRLRSKRACRARPIPSLLRAMAGT